MSSNSLCEVLRQAARPATFVLALLAASFPFGASEAGLLDGLVKQVTGKRTATDEATVAKGLKEALDVGTKNAVAEVGRENGYFGNMKVRIPLPEKLQKADSLLRKVGMGESVDEFILAMNRAAEQTAPQAADIFVAAIRDMTVVDAYRILKGDDTAATRYFQEKTTEDLYRLFRPVVTDSMGRVGVVKSYKRLMKKYTSLPLVKSEPVDLEDHVTRRALDGLFMMIGEEERKIRKDPAARVTELLRTVFGGTAK